MLNCRYITEQIPVAQIIRRFRDLDMPLKDIQAVLSAPDVQTRNDLITAHLKRLQSDLAKTRSAVASLRNLLQRPAPTADIGRRKADRVTTAAISEVVDVKDALSWYLGALGELALAVEGPLREYYLVRPHDTPEESAWRTEIGWPIFQTS